MVGLPVEVSRCRFASGVDLMRYAIDELAICWAPGWVRVDGGSVRRVWWYRCSFKEVDQADGQELGLFCFFIVVEHDDRTYRDLENS